MLKLIAGIVVTQIVMYLWGFLVWGLGPYAKLSWKDVKDLEGARASMREHFPENGTYYVPSFHGAEQAEIEQRMQEGPVAFVHMTAVDGRPLFDVSIMVFGFLLNLAAIVLMAIMLKWVSPSLPSYAPRAGFCFLLALAAVLITDVGQIAWWQLDWTWKLYQGGYDFTFFLLAGLLLSAFVDGNRKQLD